MLAFDGKQLARNYEVFFDKVVKVGGNVALVDVGDGGNQCGTDTIIVWKPEMARSKASSRRRMRRAAGGGRRQRIYFVPFLLPGASKQALQWSPSEGLTISGT